jgi:hypothetical protein
MTKHEISAMAVRPPMARGTPPIVSAIECYICCAFSFLLERKCAICMYKQRVLVITGVFKFLYSLCGIPRCPRHHYVSGHPSSRSLMTRIYLQYVIPLTAFQVVFLFKSDSHLFSFFAQTLITSIVIARTLPRERVQGLISCIKGARSNVRRHSGMLFMIVATRSGM